MDASALAQRFAFEDLAVDPVEDVARRDAAALVLHVGREAEHRTVSYGELHRDAAGAAAHLLGHGCGAGERVVLLMPQGHRLIALFFGAIYAGAVPCIVAWPTAKMDPEKYRRNLLAVVGGLAADWLVTEPAMAAQLGEALGSTRVLDVGSFGDAPPGPPAAPALGHGDPLFIQFSGGTTGTQKSVPISLEKLAQQLRAHAEVLALSPADRIISWLPLYHDMGLVACTLMPFVHRLPVSLFAPMEWVMDPGRFLAAITRDRSTLAWLPNFAYRFMAEKARWRPDTRIDLSSLRALVNCSEPVRAESMDAFLARFAPHGFRAEALHTCYAMAETTFAVTQTTAADPPRRLRVAREALGAGRVAIRMAEAAEGERVLVSCGRPIPRVDVKIVDAGGNSLDEGAIGEIWLRGDFVMDDYLPSDDRPPRWAFSEDGWYRSGDLGAFWEGHLYVTGRKKDVIIVGGVNIFPEDLESAIGEVAGVHAGRVVAMGIEAAELGTEKLVVVAEVDALADLARREQLQGEARRAVLTVAGVAPSEIFIVPPRWIVKSTAGKISRSETRARVLERWAELTAMDEPTEDDL
jgi:acyl-CoA synthetase (AMP-forming)/AMP-acid ligase II